MDNQKAIIEGLIFLSGDEGLSIEQIMESLQVDDKEAILLNILKLKEEYSDIHHGFELVEYASRFKFVTKECIYPYAQRLFEQFSRYPYHRLLLKLWPLLPTNNLLHV